MAVSYTDENTCPYWTACAHVNGTQMCPLVAASKDKTAKGTPYEIHITVAEGDVHAFQTICRAFGMKAVLLDLHLAAGGIMQDLMTSSIHRGTDDTARCEAQRLVKVLGYHGYKVVRSKIETVPWHRLAKDRPAPGSYFESHIATRCTSEGLRKLAEIAKDAGAHLSRNAFKVSGDVMTYMVTLRSRMNTREEFDERVLTLKECLEFCDFVVDKTITEFALVDTKEGHDAAWMGASA